MNEDEIVYPLSNRKALTLVAVTAIGTVVIPKVIRTVRAKVKKSNTDEQ